MEIRHCARPGCTRSAAASLTYDYGARMAWLEELVEGIEPSRYDLCTVHADGLRLPRGWQLVDSRPSAGLEGLFRAIAG